MTPVVPFLDLVTPHAKLEPELVEVFRKALRSAAFIGGEAVERFEARFAEFCGTNHCVAVASGTDALLFALLACGIGPDETVLTVANTFIATAEAISQAGAVPEFLDVDERTYTLDPAALRSYLQSCTAAPGSLHRLSRRTGKPITAIIPVHLYGQMADMDPICDIAQEFHLTIIEDACQAHGAEYFSKRQDRWLRAGTIGSAAAFSFYPGKNLGACGEAGAVTTGSPAIAQHVRMTRDHGQASKYYHDVIGYNGRLDAIQAGILDVKLRHLEPWTAQRRNAAAIYDELFATVPAVAAPYVSACLRPVYHLYELQVPRRETVQAELLHAGVQTGIHYPVPVHLQRAYRNLGYAEGSLPVTERLASELLSLPMYPTITRDQQEIVVKLISQATLKAGFRVLAVSGNRG